MDPLHDISSDVSQDEIIERLQSERDEAIQRSVIMESLWHEFMGKSWAKPPFAALYMRLHRANEGLLRNFLTHFGCLDGCSPLSRKEKNICLKIFYSLNIL